jgi:hypothetical protein
VTDENRLVSSLPVRAERAEADGFSSVKTVRAGNFSVSQCALRRALVDRLALVSVVRL